MQLLPQFKEAALLAFSPGEIAISAHKAFRGKDPLICSPNIFDGIKCFWITIHNYLSYFLIVTSS